MEKELKHEMETGKPYMDVFRSQYQRLPTRTISWIATGHTVGS